MVPVMGAVPDIGMVPVMGAVPDIGMVPVMAFPESIPCPVMPLPGPIGMVGVTEVAATGFSAAAAGVRVGDMGVWTKAAGWAAPGCCPPAQAARAMAKEARTRNTASSRAACRFDKVCERVIEFFLSESLVIGHRSQSCEELVRAPGGAISLHVRQS